MRFNTTISFAALAMLLGRLGRPLLTTLTISSLLVNFSTLAVEAKSWGWRESDEPRSIGVVFKSIKAKEEIHWTDCRFDFSEPSNGKDPKYFECAVLKVPLDWNKPETVSSNDIGAYVTIPLVRDVALNKTVGLPTAGAEKGMVLVSKGGAGETSLEMVIKEPVLEKLRKAIGPDYDIIAFDTRGFGHSTPWFNCRPSFTNEEEAMKESDNLREMQKVHSQWPDARIDLEIELSKRCNNQIDDAGKENNIAYHMSSAVIAKDMIAIEDAYSKSINRKTGGLVNFWGISYGTYLGQVFASMNPDRVGKFVLDGVIDAIRMQQNIEPWNLNRTDRSMWGILQNCYNAKSRCDFLETGDIPDLESYYRNLMYQLDKGQDVASRFIKYAERTREMMTKEGMDPFRFAKFIPKSAEPTNGHTGCTPRSWQINLPVSNWLLLEPWEWAPTFMHHFRQLRGGDECAFENLLGNYSVELEGYYWLQKRWGFLASVCSDGAPLAPGADGEISNELYNTWKDQSIIDMGESVIHKYACAGWIAKGSNRYEGSFENITTATPILFVGIYFDPRTPLDIAELSQKRFKKSGVVAVQGYGHTSFNSGEINFSCIARALRKYFDDGTLPHRPMSRDGPMWECKSEFWPVFEGKNDAVGGAMQVTEAMMIAFWLWVGLAVFMWMK